MRALKALVIGMGIMILVSVLLLAFGLYKKSVDPTWKLFGKPAQSRNDAPAAIDDFEDIRLGLAPDCRISAVTAGDNGIVYLRIGPDSSCDQVIVVDVAAGKVLGRIAP